MDQNSPEKKLTHSRRGPLENETNSGGHGVRAPGWGGGQRKNSGRGEPGDQEGAAGGGSLRVLGTDRGGASVWLQSALRLGAAGAAGEMITGGIRILADFPRWGMETGPFPKHVESFFAPTPLNRRPRYNNRRTSYTEGFFPQLIVKRTSGARWH